MNGSVIPVIGTRLATTAMFTQAWKTIQVVTPAASSAPVASGARSAMRTPLNAIVGYTSLILDEIYGEVPAAQAKAMAHPLVQKGRELFEAEVQTVIDLNGSE